jgi:hypothetical protein
MLNETRRALPYLVHTNRELGLMLKSVKPMAMLSDYVGNEAECLFRYLRMFDRQVDAGRFERQVVEEPITHRPDWSSRRTFCTLPGETWRVGAMLELIVHYGNWINEHERRFGTLLGYEDLQNDIWLECHPVGGFANGS